MIASMWQFVFGLLVIGNNIPGNGKQTGINQGRCNLSTHSRKISSPHAETIVSVNGL